MKSHMTSGLFSSRTDEWETPKDFFQKLDDEFHFDLDVCATPKNAKCKRFFTKEQDGLKQEWKGTCWMNPPYGRQISLWVKKALDSARGGGQQSSAFFHRGQTLNGGIAMSLLMPQR